MNHRLMNALQTVLLVSGLMGLLGAVGWLIGGGSYALMAMGTVCLLYFFNPAVSPALVMRLYRARRLDARIAPVPVAIMEQLAERAGLPATPTLHYVPSRLTGLLSLVGQCLLLVNLPLLIMGEQTISWLAIALLVFAPTLSALFQLALSRSREYQADLGAVMLTGDPEGLASALARLESVQGSMLERVLLPGWRIPEPSWLRTHPPTERRIERLMGLQPMPDIRPLTVSARFDPHPLLRADLRRPGWRIGGTWF